MTTQKAVQVESVPIQPQTAGSSDIPPPLAAPPAKFFDRRDWWIVGAVFLLALVVRGIYLYQSSAAPTFLAPIVDADTYHSLAKKLVATHHMEDGFFWQPFFYPFFLSLIYFAAGPSIVAAKIVQIVIGSSTCALTYLLGRRIFGRRVGIAAGLLNAFYGPLIFLEGELLGDWIEAFWSMLVLLLLLKARRGILLKAEADLSGLPGDKQAPAANYWGSVRTCFFVGACGALAVLSRPTILPFLLTAWAYLFWTYYRCRGWPLLRDGLRNAIGGLAMILAPVGALNYHVTDHFGFLPSSGGINMYIGNSEDTDRTVTIRPGYAWEQLTTWPQREGITDERAQQDFFYKQVYRYAAAHPLSFAWGMVEKTGKFLCSREIPRNVDVYMYRQWSPLLGVLAWKVDGFGFPFGVILPLAAVGLVCYWRRIPPELKMFVLLYPAAVVLVFVTGRYRLPVVPAMLILAAAGGVGLVEIIRRRRWIAAAVAGAGMAAMVALATLPGPFVEEKVNFQAELNYDLGGFYRNAQQWDKAAERFEAAIRIRPDYSDAYNELGNTRALQGRKTEAIELYRKAVEYNPKLSKAMHNIGVMEYNLGNMDAAIAILKESLAIDETNPKAHRYLGMCLVKQGQSAEAEAEFTRALKLETEAPGLFQIHVAMADLLVSRGQAEEAMRQYREALGPVIEGTVKVDPRTALRNLAWLNATSPDPNVRKPDEAVRLADKLVELNSDGKHADALPLSLDVLAAAYASAGRYNEAASVASKAASLAESAGRAGLASRIRDRLELYRNGRPYTQAGNELPE